MYFKTLYKINQFQIFGKIFRFFLYTPNENEIIDMFLKIWYDDSRLKKNTIIKSFKMTGISTKWMEVIKKK